MREYAVARGARNGAAVCNSLSEAMRARYAKGFGNCASGVRTTFDSPQRVAPPFRIRVSKGRSSGDRIVAFLEYHPGAASFTSAFQLDLVRQRGRWVIDQDDWCVTPC